MKIILSRKGFDSQYGSYPSPILPNGKMVSLPIPAPSDNSIYYKDLKLDNNKTYYNLMKELGMKEKSIKSSCHLDPDIISSIIKRDKQWRPLFGQGKSAQGHLTKQGVGEGDLFLFFGTFRKTILDNKKLKYDLKDKPKHIIFGYLQIDKIINNEVKVEEWMKYHPHCKSKRWIEWKNNTIYVAREGLSWDFNISGAGVLKYNEDLVLTAKGKTKSTWNIPILKGKKISYHNENSWKNGFFKSVSKGQEFVIQDDLSVEEWAKSLINNYL